jgi:hypothetical protein
MTVTRICEAERYGGAVHEVILQCNVRIKLHIFIVQRYEIYLDYGEKKMYARALK